MIIPLGVQSPARSSSLPAASLSERAVPRRLFGLAPAGVYPAATVADDAVRSYRTFSPLPDPTQASADGGVFSVALSVTSPRSRCVAVPRHYLAARPPEPGLSSSRHPCGSVSRSSGRHTSPPERTALRRAARAAPFALLRPCIAIASDRLVTSAPRLHSSSPRVHRKEPPHAKQAVPQSLES
jgi:hypothetical protein